MKKGQTPRKAPRTTKKEPVSLPEVSETPEPQLVEKTVESSSSTSVSASDNPFPPTHPADPHLKKATSDPTNPFPPSAPHHEVNNPFPPS